LKTTSMAGPWGALPVDLAASTTEFEMTSMAGPVGGTAGGSGSVHHQV
jgi:hypothetical protein